MATTIKIRGTSNSDEQVTLVGRAVRPLTKITSILRSRVVREVLLPIEGVADEPEVTFTADMVAPGQLQESQSVQLSVDLYSQEVPSGPLTLVEEYDPTHWDKAITSGGASAALGGANGDVLTATTTEGTAVVEFTYNVSGSPAEGTLATATIEVTEEVAEYTFELVNFPPQVVEGQQSPRLAARTVDSDGAVVQTNPFVTYAVLSGPGTIGGVDGNNHIVAEPSSAGGSITVRGTYADSLTVSPTFRDATTNVVAVAQRVLEITTLPPSVVEGQQYVLQARELDGSTGEILQNPATDVAWNVVNGPASISGGNLLNINAGSAGGSVTVSASKVGVTTDQETASIIQQQAPGSFPNNEPSGMSQIILMDGSSITPPPGFSTTSQWTSPRLQVVADPQSKYGNVVRKNYFVGDNSSWHGLIFGDLGAWSELYFRFIFMFSSNWEYHNSGNSKIIYYNKGAGGGGGENIIWGEGYGFSDSSGSAPGSVDPAYSLYVGYQIPTPPGALTGNPIIGHKVSLGVYHTIEMHHVASIGGPGTGSVRYWQDGIERTAWRKLGSGVSGTHTQNSREDAARVEAADKRIGHNIDFGLFWGGQNDVKGVNDFWQFSEFYVSGKP